MDNLNAFIANILTVDYSDFANTMEVVEMVNETKTQVGINTWRIDIDWATAVFSSFSKTEIGTEYTQAFQGGSPKEPSVELTQYALSDLFCLPNEQRQAQIDRLSNLIRLWGNNGYTGIQSDYSVLHDAFDLVQGFRLSYFDEWLKDQKIITKNIPYGSNKIHLRRNFYNLFTWHIGKKISAVHYLIDAATIRAGAAAKPNAVTKANDHLSVFVIKSGRLSLLNQLLIYVEEERQDELASLIDGNPIDVPIGLNCQQVILGEIFYNQVKHPDKTDRLIQSDKTKLAKWICQNFRRVENGTVKEFSEPTILNYLKGKGFAQYQ
ncbi:hypothetical protein ACFSUS_22550 [Spirosoma soli]|uniref:Restriction endonuclease n=1 Tax=Spirosoma soli TaxID=1770529 RepID=A0ABW5M8U4_9BACT